MFNHSWSITVLDLHGISRASFDLIVDEEVSGRETYDKKYVHPEKPGGQSGVTVGIGYDCGYYSASQIRHDWDGRIPKPMIEALASCAGIRGDAAFAACARVRSQVAVPWDAAIDVFSNVSIPKYLASTRNGLPNFDALPPDCKGALLSLVYNRGASFTLAGDRYAEMRAIRAAMAQQNPALIPGLLRKMKRLWTTKSVRGVALRREHEARLFEQGLASTHAGLVSEPEQADVEPDATAPFAADDQAAAPADEPPAPVDPDAQGDPALFSVQKRLKAMNYTPGVITGVWGGMTAAAIAGFLNDRDSEISAPTSLAKFDAVAAEIRSELSRAEAARWKRPVTAERENADPGTVAAVAPEVVPAKRNFFATVGASITAFFAAIWQTLSNWFSQAFDFLTDHKDDIPSDPGMLGTAWEYLGRVPVGVWCVLAGTVLALLAWNARNTVKTITSAVQTGARQ